MKTFSQSPSISSILLTNTEVTIMLKTSQTVHTRTRSYLCKVCICEMIIIMMIIIVMIKVTGNLCQSVQAYHCQWSTDSICCPDVDSMATNKTFHSLAFSYNKCCKKYSKKIFLMLC